MEPADPGGLNEILRGGVSSNFQLVGAFTVSVDFDIPVFPHPGYGYNEALLWLQPDNPADEFAVLKFSIRTGSTSYRETYEGWSVPPGAGFGHVTTPSRSGTFKLQRVGMETSAFLDYGTGMKDLGSVTDSAFSGPMTVRLIGTQMVRGSTGQRSFSALDIRFDNFQATADVIIPEPATLLLFATGLAAALGFVRRRKAA